MKPESINKSNLKTLYKTKYIKLYDLNYQDNAHYYIASRNDEDNLAIKKDADQLSAEKPNGVGCVLIVNDKLYLNYEYRLPLGQYTLSVPAGLIEDNEDIFSAAKREIREETGLIVRKMEMINPLMFSSPGFTDESNAMVVAYSDDNHFTQNNCEETEYFNGYVLLSKEEAKQLLKLPCDKNKNFFSVYTIVAILYFLSLDKIK
ncbi:MAG: NUDIX hydrolase [Erysipelotrichia bacterium]|nr:NUDIX hydrolase [Erysipelotrichia bacterium]